MTIDRRGIDDRESVDLFDVLDVLLNSKWLIIVCVLICALLGAGFTKLSMPNTSVSVTFNSNLTSLRAGQLCMKDVECLRHLTANLIISEVEHDWKRRKRSSVLVLKVAGIINIDDYLEELSLANHRITASLLKEAENEVAVINHELSAEMQTTERVATNFLNARRLITEIEENGTKVVSFSTAKVVHTPKLIPTIILSMIVGLGISILAVLLRDFAIRRKRKGASVINMS